MMLFGVPFGLEVNFTSWFTLVLDWEPFVNTVAIYNETAQFGGADSNALIFANIVIPNVEVQFIAQVVDLNVEVFVVPFRSFTTVIVS